MENFKEMDRYDMQDSFNIAVNEIMEYMLTNNVEESYWHIACTLYELGQFSCMNESSLRPLGETLLNTQILNLTVEEYAYYSYRCEKIKNDLERQRVER